MSDGRDRELAELEERAYGPHADIETDPAAMLRLRRLQEQRRISRAGRTREAPETPETPEPPAFESPAAGAGRRSDAASSGAEEDDVWIDADDGADDGDDDGDDAETGAEDAGVADGGRRPRRTLRVAAAVVALSAVAGASSATTWAIARFDPRQVAVLSPDSEAAPQDETGELFGPLVRYEDLFGIEVSACTRDRDGVAESCLVASQTGRYWEGTCASVELGVTTLVPVTDSSPEAARARFPADTFLELTYRGGDITVRASA
ncbi:hypothetical protein [Microbacterium oleivorans]|uniref:Uncharacterized protein n=1 Tax=Microbacterium oleivorans TaxID=273677 RepID=A0A7D5IWW5_9MICO|nr:hypothetical protein [Microbacterium oleivorans]QLD12282.1 hypothetical protein HW566_11160 [Microbacterium oleivorans]